MHKINSTKLDIHRKMIMSEITSRRRCDTVSLYSAFCSFLWDLGVVFDWYRHSENCWVGKMVLRDAIGLSTLPDMFPTYKETTDQLIGLLRGVDECFVPQQTFENQMLNALSLLHAQNDDANSIVTSVCADSENDCLVALCCLALDSGVNISSEYGISPCKQGPAVSVNSAVVESTLSQGKVARRFTAFALRRMVPTIAAMMFLAHDLSKQESAWLAQRGRNLLNAMRDYPQLEQFEKLCDRITSKDELPSDCEFFPDDDTRWLEARAHVDVLARMCKELRATGSLAGFYSSN